MPTCIFGPIPRTFSYLGLRVHRTLHTDGIRMQGDPFNTKRRSRSAPISLDETEQ